MVANEVIRSYIDAGLSVLPAVDRGKMPCVQWKKYVNVSPSTEQYDTWIEENKFGNIAMILGDDKNRLCEIDFDVPNAKDFLTDGNVAKLKGKGKVAISSQGKIKLYCKAKNTRVSGDKCVSNRAYMKADGVPSLPHIELRAFGCITILPPSLHKDTGQPYEWFDDTSFCDLEEVDVKELYDRYVDVLRGQFGYKEPEKKHRIRTCFRKTIDDGVNLIGADGHKFRVALLSEMLNCFYPEDLIYKEFQKVAVNSGEVFDFEKTKKFLEYTKKQGYLKYSCKKLQDEYEVFVGNYCSDCKTGKSEDQKEVVLFKTNYTISDNEYLEEILKDGREMFIHYNSDTDKWKEIEFYDIEGIKIYPCPINVEAQMAITLPSGLLEYGTVSELRDEMLEFGLSEYDPCEMLPQCKIYLTEALNTWICEPWQRGNAERFMPILNARGSSETGKKRFLTVFRWLTYHSMYTLATEKIPSIYRALNPLKGTLILDEADISRSDEGSEFIRFLNSRADGVSITRYNSATGVNEWFNSFGMTVIATRKNYEDDGVNSRMQVMVTKKTKKNNIALIPTESFVKKGQMLQNKLLLFRLRHMKGKMPSKCTIINIDSFRVKEALLMIQELSKEDPRMLDGIQDIAESINKQIIKDRALSKEGIMLNVIYDYLNDSKTELQPEGKDEYLKYYLIQKMVKTWNRATKNYEDVAVTALNCRNIRESIDNALNSSIIARQWEGIGQEIKPSKRFGDHTIRSVIMIKDISGLKDLFPKYIVDYHPLKILDNICQTTLGDE